MQIISILNQKGGVGKTTTTLNLGKSLSMMGKRVLLIDLDPQASLTTCFGLDNVKNINEIISKYEKEFKDLKKEQRIELISNKISLNSYDLITDEKKEKKFDIIPSNILLSEFSLKNQINLFVLKKYIRSIKDYDYILIDNKPSLDSLVINSLVASDFVLIPTKLDTLGLEGLASLLTNSISLVKEDLNEDLEILGILGTFYDNTNEAKHSLGTLKEVFSKEDNIYVFKSYIRQTTKLKECPRYCKSIFEHDKTSGASEDYLEFTKELLKITEKYE